MKKVAIIARDAFKRAGLDVWLIGTIHDENQYDVHPRDVEEVKRLYVQSIEQAGESLNCKVPFTGKCEHGSNWSECH